MKGFVTFNAVDYQQYQMMIGSVTSALEDAKGKKKRGGKRSKSGRSKEPSNKKR